MQNIFIIICWVCLSVAEKVFDDLLKALPPGPAHDDISGQKANKGVKRKADFERMSKFIL